MLALLFGAIVVCTALVGLVCFNWDRLRRPHLNLRREKAEKQLWAIPAPLSLHPGVEQRPQPKVEEDMTSSSKGNLPMPEFNAPRKDTRSQPFEVTGKNFRVKFH